jgi:hypothetical protein
MRIPILATTIIGLTVCFAATRSDGSRRDDGRAWSVFSWYRPEWQLNKILADLAKAQGLDPEDYRKYRWPNGAFSLFTEDCMGIGVSSDPSYIRAVSLGDKREDDYVVAVQTVTALGIPGTSAQQLVLLTSDGKILDRVQCDINSRYGETKTEIFPQPDSDGASIVIHFIGMPTKLNPHGPRSSWVRNSCPYWHRIIFHGKWWMFHMDDKESKNAASQWHVQGLCRVAITNQRFKVLFPTLEMLDLSKTSPLKVTYWLGATMKRHLVVDDPAEIAGLLAAIKIEGREQHYPEPQETGGPNSLAARVDFPMTGGGFRRMTFESDRVLKDARGGKFHLSNTAFFEALSKTVSKPEGKAVSLLTGAENVRDTK